MDSKSLHQRLRNTYMLPFKEDLDKFDDGMMINTYKWLLKVFDLKLNLDFTTCRSYEAVKLYRILTNIDLGHIVPKAHQILQHNQFLKIVSALMDTIERKHGKNVLSCAIRVMKLHQFQVKKVVPSNSSEKNKKPNSNPDKTPIRNSLKGINENAIPCGKSLPRTPFGQTKSKIRSSLTTFSQAPKVKKPIVSTSKIEVGVPIKPQESSYMSVEHTSVDSDAIFQQIILELTDPTFRKLCTILGPFILQVVKELKLYPLNNGIDPELTKSVLVYLNHKMLPDQFGSHVNDTFSGPPKFNSYDNNEKHVEHLMDESLEKASFNKSSNNDQHINPGQETMVVAGSSEQNGMEHRKNIEKSPQSAPYDDVDGIQCRSVSRKRSPSCMPCSDSVAMSAKPEDYSECSSPHKKLRMSPIIVFNEMLTDNSDEIVTAPENIEPMVREDETERKHNVKGMESVGEEANCETKPKKRQYKPRKMNITKQANVEQVEGKMGNQKTQIKPGRKLKAKENTDSCKSDVESSDNLHASNVGTKSAQSDIGKHTSQESVNSTVPSIQGDGVPGSGEASKENIAVENVSNYEISKTVASAGNTQDFDEPVLGKKAKQSTQIKTRKRKPKANDKTDSCKSDVGSSDNLQAPDLTIKSSQGDDHQLKSPKSTVSLSKGNVGPVNEEVLKEVMAVENVPISEVATSVSPKVDQYPQKISTVEQKAAESNDNSDEEKKVTKVTKGRLKTKADQKKKYQKRGPKKTIEDELTDDQFEFKSPNESPIPTNKAKKRPQKVNKRILEDKGNEDNIQGNLSGNKVVGSGAQIRGTNKDLQTSSDDLSSSFDSIPGKIKLFNKNETSDMKLKSDDQVESRRPRRGATRKILNYCEVTP